MGKFVLSDISRKALTGEPGPSNTLPPPQKWLGHMVVAAPFEAHTSLNFTGPPGSTSAIYYGLFFQLGKWEYNIRKANEWIEVSPIHAQYYNLTHKQKDELEGRIKAGLQSVSQSVADYELILHDQRKYEEFLRYMGYRTPKETPDHKGHSHPNGDGLCLEVDNDDKTRKAREKIVDNHSLKAVFVDQVDVHTGDGISIRSIISRWPTLIIDFMKVGDDDMDTNKVAEKLNISRAEAVVLVTKNKLYVEWKRLFLGNLVDRYSRLQSLRTARERSVKEYKEWLKPIIARHKLISEGLSSEGTRSEMLQSFIASAGHAVSNTEIEVWVWKDFTPPEFYKSGSEEIAKLTDGKDRTKWKLTPYDKWTKKNLIFHEKHGLVKDYPWITEKWVIDQMNDMYDNGWLTKHKLYYSFFIIKTIKGNTRTPTGEELEDGVFDVNMIVMSQNAMFAKLLELKAKQHEFEEYVNGLLGMQTPVEGKKPNTEEKDHLESIKKFLEWFSFDFTFFKRGPYERDFDERLTKYYFAPIAGERYLPIVGFIKSKMGMGN